MGRRGRAEGFKKRVKMRIMRLELVQVQKNKDLYIGKNNEVDDQKLRVLDGVI